MGVGKGMRVGGGGGKGGGGRLDRSSMRGRGIGYLVRIRILGLGGMGARLGAVWHWPDKAGGGVGGKVHKRQPRNPTLAVAQGLGGPAPVNMSAPNWSPLRKWFASAVPLRMTVCLPKLGVTHQLQVL